MLRFDTAISPSSIDGIREAAKAAKPGKSLHAI